MYPVISISGPPGSGKTALCEALAGIFSCEVIRYDDYPGLTSSDMDQVQEWMKSDMPFEALFIEDFREKILDTRVSKPVIFESPLGPLHGQEGVTVDLSIWLDCGPDIALARALLKILNEDEWANSGELLRWTNGYLRSYLDFVSLAIRKQSDMVRPHCGVVLDSNVELPSLVANAAEAIRAGLEL